MEYIHPPSTYIYEVGGLLRSWLAGDSASFLLRQKLGIGMMRLSFIARLQALYRKPSIAPQKRKVFLSLSLSLSSALSEKQNRSPHNTTRQGDERNVLFSTHFTRGQSERSDLFCC